MDPTESTLTKNMQESSGLCQKIVWIVLGPLYYNSLYYIVYKSVVYNIPYIVWCVIFKGMVI